MSEALDYAELSLGTESAALVAHGLLDEAAAFEVVGRLRRFRDDELHEEGLRQTAGPFFATRSHDNVPGSWSVTVERQRTTWYEYGEPEQTDGVRPISTRNVLTSIVVSVMDLHLHDTDDPTDPVVQGVPFFQGILFDLVQSYEKDPETGECTKLIVHSAPVPEAADPEMLRAYYEQEICLYWLQAAMRR